MTRTTQAAPLDPSRCREILTTVGPPPRTSLGYQVSLCLTTCFLLLLPLCYLALAAAVGLAGLWWTLAGGQYFPQTGPASHGLSFLLLRYGPSFVVTVMLLALIKPLISRRARPPETVELDRQEQALLFAYVNQIATLLGAPRPARIEVDLEVNASASFRRGWRSLWSRDLTLTLGLPLVSGLDLRELTAVIAHELGHFSQTAGMRLSFLIRSLARWFQRVIYERDNFDLLLERGAKSSRHAFTLALLQGARGGVWLARRILLGLMRLGELASGTLGRQMEFDADAQAMRIAGSAAFSSSMLGIYLLDQANAGATYDVNRGLQEGKLGDDWIDLIQANLEQMPPEVRQRTLASAAGQSAHMYASHPPTGQRIARARAVALPSGVALEAPGAVLIKDFKALVRRLTIEHYRRCLGSNFTADMLRPSATLNAEVERQVSVERLVYQQLGSRWTGPHLLSVSAFEAVPSCGSGGTLLADLAERERAARDLYDQAIAQLAEMEPNARVRALVGLFERAKLKIHRRRHGIGKHEQLPHLSLELRRAELQQRLAALEQHARPLWERFNGALKAFESPPLQAQLESSGGLLPTARTSLELLRVLGGLAPDLELLRLNGDLLRRAGPLLSEAATKTSLPVLQELVEDQRRLLQTLEASLGQRAYPFDHSEAGIGLARAVLGPADLEQANSEALLSISAQAHERLIALQVRALGHLLAAAGAAERAEASRQGAAA